jgi:hypothetical protein
MMSFSASSTHFHEKKITSRPFCSGVIFISLYNSNTLLGIHDAEKIARTESAPQHIAAMNAFIAAMSFIPEDLDILKNIADAAKMIHWIEWGSEVHAAIERYKILRRP